MEISGKYRLCQRIFELVKNSGLFSLVEFNELIQSNSATFNSEFQLGPADYKQLNTTYKEFLRTKCPPLNLQQMELFEFFGESLLHTLNSCATKRRHQLFSDLLHMHINRLFPDQQLKHEMIVYYLFSRILKRENNELRNLFNPESDVVSIKI